MIHFFKDLLVGEPVLATSLIATGLGAWVAALVASGMPVPLWLAVATPVASAIAGFYGRSKVRPEAHLVGGEYVEPGDEELGH